VIRRPVDEARLETALGRAPVVVLVGPRQAGKSTLARTVVEPTPTNVFDLEDPRDVARLGDATSSLPLLDGTVVIDEAQRVPDLFPMLRVLVDADRRPGRFLVLGSASPALIGMAAESLAGRVAIIELPGLRPIDFEPEQFDTLWRRGGLPPATLAPDEPAAHAWLEDYIATFLERDLANLGVRTPATTMRRFWTMLAHLHGQTWNASELARSLGVSAPTVRTYLDSLTDALVVRQLTPWHANLGKRQVKAPKVYLRDTGLLHRLLSIIDDTSLLSHPKVGASWEGFVIEQLITLNAEHDPSFWATQSGAELDLRLTVNGQPIGVEVKRTDRPSTTRSMHIALNDLGLAHLLVAHAGRLRFPLTDRITAIPAVDLLRNPIASFLPG
jgi:uncharacterized protein